jgi:NAD(P)H-hydrate repair Nnr-like enzyme with NAD(P)H-hydrate epimerase domain
MKLNKLHRIVDAIELINEETKTNDLPAIVDALVGVALSEEDAGEIKSYFEDTKDIIIID